MGMKRDNLEWQLERANAELSAFEKELDQNAVAVDARKRNAKWRNLSSHCRQLRNRLNAVARVEANNIEVTNRKAAKTAEPAAAG